MTELKEESIFFNNRPSSKGNQLKWNNEGFWYKADYSGYEGLAEYMVSGLLKHSSLSENEFVPYELEQIKYKKQTFNGCKSQDFANGKQLITAERLIKATSGISLHDSVYSIRNVEERLKFAVEILEKATGLKDVGPHLAKAVTIDAVFLNEDRHWHNIAFLMDDNGSYQLCPFFDHGAALLSDTTMDYPLSENWESLIPEVRPRTFSLNFEEQLDAVEKLFGRTITFSYSHEDAVRLLESATCYDTAIKDRVLAITDESRRKYQYLFKQN
ncbi:MAG: hypothetical protein HUJ70_01420 [Pseudobutyrivibrio sp.]|nr:hypothetical protein [Pseudobutyrivibrio sp.]